jgi:hypothetical protein
MNILEVQFTKQFTEFVTLYPMIGEVKNNCARQLMLSLTTVCD